MTGTWGWAAGCRGRPGCGFVGCGASGGWTGWGRPCRCWLGGRGFGWCGLGDRGTRRLSRWFRRSRRRGRLRPRCRRSSSRSWYGFGRCWRGGGLDGCRSRRCCDHLRFGDRLHGRCRLGCCWLCRCCGFCLGRCRFGGGRLLDRKDRLARRWFGRDRRFAAVAVGLQQAADLSGFGVTDGAAVALGCDRQLLGRIQHVLVLKAQVLGQLVNSDFAAAGHSGRISGRAGHGVPRWPHAMRGQCSVCLSGHVRCITEPLFQRCQDIIGHLATQGFLKSFAASGLFKACLALTEIGRSAHAPVNTDPILMVSDHPPERAAIEKLAAGHTATQDGALIHRATSLSSSDAGASEDSPSTTSSVTFSLPAPSPST